MTRRTPWKNRTDSFARGYVAGSMIGGLVATALLVVIAGLFGATALWWLVVPYGLLTALACFMWEHG